MRHLPALVLAVSVILLSGCFEASKAAFAVTVNATTVARTTDGTGGDVVFTVRNDHPKAIGAVSLRLTFERLSGDGFVAPGRIKLDAQPTNVIGADGVYTITSMMPQSSLTIRPKLIYEPGTYRWTLTVNGDRALLEKAWRDNSASSVVTVTAVPPATGLDLGVGTPTAMTLVGDEIRMNVPLTVSGGRAYAVRCDVVSEGEDGYFFQIHAWLDVGSHSLSLRAPVPAGGVGAITIYVDPFNDIGEANEGNNVISVMFPAGGAG